MKPLNSFLLVALVLLSACSGSSARQIIGLDRRAPDAYAVTTQAPLEVPANLVNLPRPQPGAPRPQDVTAQQMARGALGAGTAVVAPAPSAAEQALLAKLGPTDPNVRRAVTTEAEDDADTQSGPLDWMLFWRDKPEPGVVVDAAAEAARLKAAREQGQSVTATPTPVVEDSGRLSVPKEIQ